MTRSSPPWRVVLVVEDNSDGEACRVLMDRLGYDLTLDWLPAHGVGNIKRRGALLIELARDRIADGRGCVAVLLDRDGKNVSRAEPHRTIRRICRDADVPLILAVESLEAWLLADAGCSGWLGLAQPTDADGLAQPKRELEQAYYRRTHRSYTRRARRIVADHANGSGARASTSLRDALGQLQDSPCGAARDHPEGAR